MAEQAFSIIESNLRAMMKFFGRASGKGDVTERDGLLLIDSGVNYAVFNIAMLTSEVRTRDELVRRLAVAAKYFEQRQTRWSMWICEEMLTNGLRQKAPLLLADERLRKLTEAPGMMAERLRPPSRTLPAVEHRRVCDAKTRADFAHITSMNFDIPFVTCRSVYGDERAWAYDYHGYVGYVKGTPVATTAVVVAANAIGIYSVSTLPQHRRMGYAERLMRDVIAGYRESHGLELTVLQATRAGMQMYTKMGYRAVSHISVYMT